MDIRRSVCFNATGMKLRKVKLEVQLVHVAEKKCIDDVRQEIAREKTVWRNWVQMGR
jgi:hypothetical protein